MRVLGVFPAVEAGVQVRSLDPLSVLLLHPKVYLEQINEVVKEESVVDVSLDVVRQLSHESHIDLRFDRVVLVVGPVVFEVSLESLGHLLRQRTTSVEMSEKSEPFGKVLTVFVVSGNTLQVHQNVNELTHDVGETSNTDKKDKCRHDSFNFTLRVVVTETDS